MGGPLPAPRPAEAPPASSTLTEQLVSHGASFAGSLIAIGIGCADAFTRTRWGTPIDLGLIALGLGGLGLQAGGVLPR